MNTTAPPAESTRSLASKVSALARDIKLSHTVFAMPFALLAMFLSAGWSGRLPHTSEFILICFCMFCARTVAMSVNRLADAKLDVSNPRTAGRALPSGQLDRVAVIVVIAVFSLLFIAFAGMFWRLSGNPWPVILSPFVLVYLSAYSYTKRFTWLCHLYLGTALALSPIAAVIAIEPGYLRLAEPWLLAGMVACWVGGFDVIYALQDVEHDRSLGLFSMPAKLGVGRAIWISRGLHVLSALCLFMLWRSSPPLGGVFLTASVLVVALLVLEHALVWRSKTNHINVAFLTVNGAVSLLLGAAGIVEVVLGS